MAKPRLSCGDIVQVHGAGPRWQVTAFFKKTGMAVLVRREANGSYRDEVPIADLVVRETGFEVALRGA